MADDNVEGNSAPRFMVDDYVTGRLNPLDEERFAERLICDSELQELVFAAATMRDGLKDLPQARIRSWPKTVLTSAASLLIGIIAGSSFFATPSPEAIITAAPYTLSGTSRGFGNDEVLVVGDTASGVTLLLPTGRCDRIRVVEITDGKGRIVGRATDLDVEFGLSVTIPDPGPGYYNVALDYEGCAAERRGLFIAPDREFVLAKAQIFSRTWRIAPAPTTGLVAEGGSVTISVEPKGTQTEVVIGAKGMGEFDAVWNAARARFVLDEDPRIEGTLSHGNKVYDFVIRHDDNRINSEVRLRDGSAAKGDGEEGEWTGQP